MEFDLGTVPSDEQCEQLGPRYDAIRARAEAKAFVGQLERQFPEVLDTDVTFRIQSNPHDFGNYYSVQVRAESAAGVELAFKIERNVPSQWDAEARKQLKRNRKGVRR